MEYCSKGLGITEQCKAVLLLATWSTRVESTFGCSASVDRANAETLSVLSRGLAPTSFQQEAAAN